MQIECHHLGSRSTDTYPKVSIIIPNFHSLKDTMECLGSLEAITYPNYDAVIVQLKSAEDAKVLRDNYGDNIHLIEMNGDPGLAGTNNLGITYALDNGADYVLLLMNDVIGDPEFLTEMVKIAENKPEIGLLSPMIFSYFQPDKLEYPYQPGWSLAGVSCLRNILIQLASGISFKKRQFDKVSRVNFSCGGCSVLKRKLLETVGLLDPLFFWTAEDVDIWLRSIKAGFDFAVVPSAKIWHKGRGSLRTRTAFHWYYMVRSPIVLARKHFNPLALIVYCAFLIVFQIPVWILESVIFNRSPKFISAIIQGVHDGLKENLRNHAKKA